MAGNTNMGLFVQAKLDETASLKNLNEQLAKLAPKLDAIKVKIVADTADLGKFTKQLQSMQKSVSSNSSKMKVIDFQTLKEQGLKTFTSLETALKHFKASIQGNSKVTLLNQNWDKQTGQLKSFVLEIQKATGEIQKLNYATANVQFKNGRVGQRFIQTGQKITKPPTNEQVLNSLYAQAARQREQVLQAEQNFRIALAQTVGAQLTSDEDILSRMYAEAAQKREQVLQAEQKMRIALAESDVALQEKTNADKLKADQDYVAMWENLLKEQESLYEDNLNSQISKVKARYDLELQSASTTYRQLRQLYTDNLAIFEADTDKQISILKDLADMQEKASGVGRTSSSEGFGAGFGLVGTGAMILQWSALMGAMSNLKKGFVDVTQSAAGLEQVFPQAQQGEQSLVSTTNQFIDIAKQLGVSITDVTDSAKLWGRQYHDVNEALALTHNSTMLSVVDNMTVADANKAVESSMQAMGIQATNYGTAMKNSMKLVDSWTSVSHNASVSANDLTQGFERSAAAAHQAGMTVDQLNAIVSSGVRNTGRSGGIIGNMWKSVLANIESDSPKVINAFKQLGISMTETGKNGQQQLVPVYNLILELSQKLAQHTPDTQKYFEAIAGGKYQFDTLEAAISNTDAITQAYSASVHSQGDAQKNAAMTTQTFGAQLQRLADTVQQAAFNKTNSNGLMQFLAGLISNITNFVNVLGHIPTGVYEFIAVLAALKLATSGVSSVFSGIQNSVKSFTNTLGLVKTRVNDVTAAIQGQNVATTKQLATQALMNDANLAMSESTIVLTGSQTIQTAQTETQTGAIITNTAMKATNTATSGLLSIAQGALTFATNITTGAVRGLTAAFAGLDWASMGIMVAIGAVVTIIMSMANASIHADQANQDLSNSLTALQQKNQEYAQTMEQNHQTLLSNVDDIQTLGDKYVELKKTIDDTKKGTDAYNQATSDLDVVKAKLLPLLTQEQQQNLLTAKSYDDIINVYENARQASIQLQITKLQSDQSQMQSENSLTKNTIDNTNSIIHSYQNRIKALQGMQKALDAQTPTSPAVADLQSARQSVYTDQINNLQGLIGQDQQYNKIRHGKDVSNEQRYLADQKQIQQLQNELDALKKNKKELLSNSPDSSGSGSGSGKGSGSGSGSALSNYKANNPDPYTAKLDDIDAKIKALEADQKKYNSTSAEYRNDLQQQIPLLEQKKQAMQDEQNMYEKQIGQLETLQKNTSKQSQKDAISKQIQTYTDKVHQLNKDMSSVQGNINSVNDAIAKSNLESYFNSLNNRVSGINTNITNLKNSLDLLNSSNADDQTKSEINQKMAQEYKVLYNALQQNIASLEKEGSTLNKNSAAWATYQSELKNVESQAHSTAQAMAQLASSTQSDLINNLNNMETQLTQQIETQRKQDAADIKQAQSQKNVWDQTDWNSTVQTTQNDLNETINGKYQTPINFDASAQAQAMSDVNAQMAQYGNSLNSVNAELQQFQGFSTDSYSAMKSQIMSEINYLSGSNGLESQLKTVNTQISNMTEEYKTQEDALQNQITMITNSYDNQIKALQQKQSALDTEYQTEDALTNLYKEQAKVQQDLLDKHYEYIDAQGKVTYTYNKSLVSQDSLTLQKDTLTQQRDMQKQALQNQIDDLTNAKDQQTQLLQQELTNMKQIHADQLQEMKDYASNLQTLMQNINSDISDKTSQLDQMYQDQENKVTNGFDSLKSAIQNGTENISTLLYGKDGKGGWMAQMIAEAKQFGIDFGNQITSIANDVQTLFSLSSSIQNQLSIENAMNGIGKAINSTGRPTISAGGASGRPIITAFHTGGVVGSDSVASSSMIDKLFNTAPNEQIIKALVGEVMIPPNNITKNFIPAMKSFAGAVQQNSPQDNSKNYNFQNVTVVANDPTEFLNGIQDMIRSERT